MEKKNIKKKLQSKIDFISYSKSSFVILCNKMIYSRHVLSSRKNIAYILSEICDLYKFNYIMDNDENDEFILRIRISFDEQVSRYLMDLLYKDLKYNLNLYYSSSCINYGEKQISIRCFLYI